MSVTKTQDGKWRVQCWYTDWKGERHHKCKRGFERKKDAELWERKFKSSTHDETIYMDRLIDEYKEYCLTRCKLGKIKESTLEIKFVLIDSYIAKYFSNVDASKIKTKDINGWLSSLKPKRESLEQLSSGTINNIRKTLRQIFEYGIVNHDFKKNPVERSERAESFTNDKRKQFWTIDEYNVFYSALNNEQHRVVFNLMYWGGLRVGEVLCLTKADFSDNKVSIVKTVNRSKKRSINKTDTNTPKTSSSKRTVVIPQKLVKQINSYINKIPCLKPTDKIFNMSISGVTALLVRRIARLKLPYISPHNLRHSYASNMLDKTQNVTIVAEQLGHKNADVTMRYYAHMLPKAAAPVVDAINDLMN